MLEESVGVQLFDICLNDLLAAPLLVLQRQLGFGAERARTLSHRVTEGAAAQL